MGLTEWVVLLAVVWSVIFIVVGVLGGRFASRTSAGYFVADRSLGYGVALFSFMATWYSAYMFLGLHGASYRAGMASFIQGYIVLAVTIGFLFTGIPAWLLGKKYGYVSASDLIVDRYQSKGIGVWFGVLWLLFMVPNMISQVAGAGYALAGITNNAIPYWVGAIAMSAVVLAYTAPGGFKGVAWVDAIQGIFLLALLWASFGLLFTVAGGDFSSLVQRIASSPDKNLLTIPGLVPMWEYGQWFFLGTFGLFWGCFPHMYTRWYSCRNPKVIVVVILVTAVLTPLVFFHAAYGGVVTRTLLPGLQGLTVDSVLPMAVAKYAAPWFSGLLAAAVWAAIMSTVGSMLIAISVITVKDIYGGLVKTKLSEGRSVTLGRAAVIVFTVICTLIALQPPALIVTLQMLFFAGGMQLGPAIMAGYWWPRANKYGAFAGTAVGAVVLFIQVVGGNIQTSWFGVPPGLIAVIPNVVVFVAVSLLTPAPSEEIQEKFHGYLAARLGLRKDSGRVRAGGTIGAEPQPS